MIDFNKFFDATSLCRVDIDRECTDVHYMMWEQKIHTGRSTVTLEFMNGCSCALRFCTKEKTDQFLEDLKPFIGGSK